MRINQHTLINQTRFIEYLAKKFNFDIATEALNLKKDEGVKVMGYTSEDMLDINEIIKQVEKESDIPYGSIKSKSRKGEHVIARFAIWYVLHDKDAKVFNKSWLGKAVYRDHASVIHGIKTVKDMLDTNDYRYLEAIQIVTRLVDDCLFEKESVVIKKAEVPRGLFCSAYAKKEQPKSEIINWSEREFVQY